MTDDAASFTSTSIECVVTVLNEHDVLLGRGAPILNSAGNVRFRRLIKENRPAYTATGRHAVKDEIAKKILQEIIDKGGRFLRKIESEEERDKYNIPKSVLHAWVTIDKAAQLQKVKQALREQITTTSRDSTTSSASLAQSQRKPQLAGTGKNRPIRRNEQKRDQDTSDDPGPIAAAGPASDFTSISSINAFARDFQQQRSSGGDSSGSRSSNLPAFLPPAQHQQEPSISEQTLLLHRQLALESQHRQMMMMMRRSGNNRSPTTATTMMIDPYRHHQQQLLIDRQLLQQHQTRTSLEDLLLRYGPSMAGSLLPSLPPPPPNILDNNPYPYRDAAAAIVDNDNDDRQQQLLLDRYVLDLQLRGEIIAREIALAREAQQRLAILQQQQQQQLGGERYPRVATAATTTTTTTTTAEAAAVANPQLSSSSSSSVSSPAPRRKGTRKNVGSDTSDDDEYDDAKPRAI